VTSAASGPVPLESRYDRVCVSFRERKGAWATMIDYDQLREEVREASTPEERRAYEDSYSDAEAAIALSELVYTMRASAGISQKE